VRRLAACLVVVVAAWPRPAAALSTLHKRGNFIFSFGCSVSHTSYRGRTVTTYDYAEATGEYDFPEIVVIDKKTNYTDVNVALFLSTGYFVWQGLEFGLSGTTMGSWYQNSSQSDLSIYDFELHTKYFFDNASSLTPFLGLKGGLSWLDVGEYQEQDTIAGFTAGLEYSGMGSTTWFLEYGSKYTFTGADLTGTEWENRVYVGITYYTDFCKKPDPPPVAP